MSDDIKEQAWRDSGKPPRRDQCDPAFVKWFDEWFAREGEATYRRIMGKQQ